MNGLRRYRCVGFTDKGFEAAIIKSLKGEIMSTLGKK